MAEWSHLALEGFVSIVILPPSPYGRQHTTSIPALGWWQHRIAPRVLVVAASPRGFQNKIPGVHLPEIQIREVWDVAQKSQVLLRSRW